MATGLGNAGLPNDWVAPYFAGLSDPAKRKEAIQALDIASSQGHIPLNAEFCARAVIGDTDGAMRLARKLEQPGELFEMDLLFIPEMESLWRHDEFMPLLKHVGIIDYWKSKDCHWDGGSVRCPED